MVGDGNLHKRSTGALGDYVPTSTKGTRNEKTGRNHFTGQGRDNKRCVTLSPPAVVPRSQTQGRCSGVRRQPLNTLRTM